MTDPFASEHLDDPYPLYQRLRDRPEDLVESKERGILLAARYDVVRRVLLDHRTWRSSLGTQWVAVADSGLPAAVFIESDPPEHTRIRRAAQPFFNARRDARPPAHGRGGRPPARRAIRGFGTLPLAVEPVVS